MTTEATHACPTCRRTFNLFKMTSNDRRLARLLADEDATTREHLTIHALEKVATDIRQKISIGHLDMP